MGAPEAGRDHCFEETAQHWADHVDHSRSRVVDFVEPGGVKYLAMLAEPGGDRTVALVVEWVGDLQSC